MATFSERQRTYFYRYNTHTTFVRSGMMMSKGIDALDVFHSPKRGVFTLRYVNCLHQNL